MFSDVQIWYRLAIALGIGLLIGVERERRKGSGTTRSPAGIRTFAVVSLLGAVSITLGDALLLAVAAFGVAAFAAIAYFRSAREDPGLTTEVALLLTLLLGALATRQPALAAGVGVGVAVLLAARSRLHHFARSVLTENELTDALMLAAATLVVLPLVPDRHLGPFDAINPRIAWIIVVLMLAIGALGHVALRLFGARYGLALAGFASGFVSSVATIGAMGARAARTGNLMRPAVAGAVLSSVATVLQMVAVLAATSVATLQLLALPFALSGAVAVAYGALFMLRTARQRSSDEVQEGRAFSFGRALAFAALISAVLFAAAALEASFGRAGLVTAAAIAGFADTHAAAVSVASLVASGRLDAEAAALPILVGYTTNTATKVMVALIGGNWRFAAQVVPGLALMLAAAWLGWALA